MHAHTSKRLPALATAFACLFLTACSTTPTSAPVAPTAQAAPRPAPAPAPVVAAPQPAPAPAPAVVYTPAPAPIYSQQNYSPVQGQTISSPGLSALREGLAAFQKRDYRTAEAKLAQSQQQGLSQLEEVQQATKTQAFVYCLTKRTAKCEEAFTELLSLDRSYDLSGADRRNPAWAASFAKVKNRMRN
jgi:pyruvate/2-oxoglutarate dehydrogenase complex dihydrolipoamide acyltransferase (E2) component